MGSAFFSFRMVTCEVQARVFVERLDRSRNYDRFPFVGLVGLPECARRVESRGCAATVGGCYSSTSASNLDVRFTSTAAVRFAQIADVSVVADNGST